MSDKGLPVRERLEQEKVPGALVTVRYVTVRKPSYSRQEIVPVRDLAETARDVYRV